MNKVQIVYIICDDSKKTSGISSLVKRYHTTIEIPLENARTHDFMRSLMIIVDVALDNHHHILLLKEVMDNPTLANIPSLFVLDAMNRREVVQSKALGATEFIARPYSEDSFIKLLGKIANKKIESSWSNLNKTQEAALKVSLKVFEDTFKGVREGRHFLQESVKEGCDLIIEATAKDGLTGWLDAVKEHHNQTYRHSMVVCGLLVSFGLLLNVRGSDLQRLAICGLVHDIGKAKIPLSVLDKNGKLSDEDWIVMREHTNHTRSIMLESDCDPDILDGAVHHHERLDGTGYPDGYAGDEVSDFARMVAIADVFSSMTEKRSYKPAIPAKKAYEQMMEMRGHLDIDLVQAFEPIARDVA